MSSTVKRLTVAVFLTLATGATATAAGPLNPLTGTRTSDTGLSAIPPKVAFGELKISDDVSAMRQVVIHNTSGHAIHPVIGSLSDHALSIDDHDCTERDDLPADQACTIGVRWQPHQAGTLATAIIIHSEAGDLLIELSGTANGAFSARPKSGANAGVLVVDPPNVNFSEGGAGTEVVLLSNSGDQPVKLAKIDMAKSGSYIELSGTCAADMTIRPGQSCELSVTWAGGGGLRTAVLITHDGLRGMLSIPVRGTSTTSSTSTSTTTNATAIPPSTHSDQTSAEHAPKTEMPTETTPATTLPAARVGTQLVAIGGNAVSMSIDGEVTAYARHATVVIGTAQWELVEIGMDCIRLATIPIPLRGQRPEQHFCVRNANTAGKGNNTNSTPHDDDLEKVLKGAVK